MKTPIRDFLLSYANSNPVRMHMPGHKGRGEIEKYDITEVAGADSLYDANGIIAESERNASQLFGAQTFFSTEGSSLAIRAMLYLAVSYAATHGLSRRILAARCAHKVFVSASALLDFDIEWIESQGSILSADVSAEDVERHLTNSSEPPLAVYITSPDYLGGVVDIEGISRVCKKHGVLLLVDAAHGSYMKFLPQSEFPTDLGADMCASSAHKTLPVLTGGAYLHISQNDTHGFAVRAKEALSLFGSTSPSYLILASLDDANRILNGTFRQDLSSLVDKIKEIKHKLADYDFDVISKEDMKIALATKRIGYYGYELAKILFASGIEVEFSDPDYLVLMPSPSDPNAIFQAADVLLSVEKKEPILTPAPKAPESFPKMKAREAIMRESELIETDSALGRILASPSVSCPPAVPILVSGELITEEAISAFRYYGIEKIKVIK